MWPECQIAPPQIVPDMLDVEAFILHCRDRWWEKSHYRRSFDLAEVDISDYADKVLLTLTLIVNEGL